MLRTGKSAVSVACSLLFVTAGVAWACKYSVRDVAFVDILPQPYHAYIHVNAETSPEARAEIASAAAAVFLDANVTGEVVDLDAHANHPSAREVSRPAPRIVLESPDGRVMSLPIGRGADPSADEVWAAIEAVATSRARRQVRRRMFDAHSVILVVEGAAADANRRAARIAQEATTRVEGGMDALPKPIAKPPHTVVIPADRAAEEAVLLWSLGVVRAHDDDAYVVALFGRMRRLGDVLTVPGATEDALYKMLDLVGQDCECTLDRSWMQGMMLPHYWDTQDEARALDSLAFDPGNPLVIAEVSRIVNRPSILTDAPTDSVGGSLGYTELAIAGEEARPAARAQGQTATPVSHADTSSVVVADDGATLPIGPTAAAIVLMALGGGAFVFVRSRRAS
ncbi:hypothetical protein CMK11_12630 [Candidatus Poribacteria bacterium]|nr:hypothetical protein [Candidatus Poribacteria bacterium]